MGSKFNSDAQLALGTNLQIPPSENLSRQINSSTYFTSFVVTMQSMDIPQVLDIPPIFGVASQGADQYLNLPADNPQVPPLAGAGDTAPPAFDPNKSIAQMILDGTIKASPEVMGQLVFQGIDAIAISQMNNPIAQEASSILKGFGIDLQKMLAGAQSAFLTKDLLASKDSSEKPSDINITLTNDPQKANFVIDIKGNLVCTKIPLAGDKEITFYLSPNPDKLLSGPTDAQIAALSKYAADLQNALTVETSAGAARPTLDKSITAYIAKEPPPPPTVAPAPVPPGKGGRGTGTGGGGSPAEGPSGSPEVPAVPKKFPPANVAPQIPQNPFTPPSDEPILNEDNPQLLAMKDGAAGLYSPNANYASFADRGSDGMGAGRYEFTATDVLSWLDSADLSELDGDEDDGTSDTTASDPAKSTGGKPGKDGKSATTKSSGKKKHFSKGTKARLLAIQNSLHAFRDAHKSEYKTDHDLEIGFLQAEAKNPDQAIKDADATGMISLLKRMYSKDQTLTKDDLTKTFGSNLQELMADDKLNVYAAQYQKDNPGPLDPNKAASTLSLALYLGRYPTAQDLVDNKGKVDQATTDFPLSVAARTWQMSTGAIDASVGDPRSYMVTQFKSDLNPSNRDVHNENCGPSALLTTLRRYLPEFRNIPGRDIQDTIVGLWGKMGVSGPDGSEFNRLKKVAESYKLNTKFDSIPKSSDLSEVDAFFRDHPGGSYILLGHPQGIWDNQPNYISAGAGDHIVSVLGESADGRSFTIADSLCPTPFTVSRQQLQQYIANTSSANSSSAGLGIWP